jgi:quercetin dioxygenase-like cupin family protein
MTQLTGRSNRLGIPLATDEETGWKPYPLFNGTTANHEDLSCHVSSLRSGSIPHPPHRHREEELLLLLDGEVDLLLPDLEPTGGDHRVRLQPGDFVYYPAHFAHSLQAVGESPANYLMFKWFSEPKIDRGELGYLFNPSILSTDTEAVTGFKTRLLFEGPTACLRKLQSHASELAPGAGYDAHVDAHDVAIIVYSGEIETQGSRYGPHSVIYFPAGELHGMKNPGTEPANYLVFEFHGSNGALSSLRKPPSRSLLRRLASPKSWKRLLSKGLRRLRG